MSLLASARPRAARCERLKNNSREAWRTTPAAVGTMKHVEMIPGAMLLRIIVMLVVESGWIFQSHHLLCLTAVVGMVRIALTAVPGVMPHPATVRDLVKEISSMHIAAAGMERTVVMMYGAIHLTRTALFVVDNSLTQSWLPLHALPAGTGALIVLHAVKTWCVYNMRDTLDVAIKVSIKRKE